MLVKAGGFAVHLGDPAGWPVDAPVAFGGDLDADLLLGGYTHGCFPMPAVSAEAAEELAAFYHAEVGTGAIAVLPTTDSPFRVPWWSPDPRMVLDVGRIHVGRDVRRLVRGRPLWWTSANRAFDRVVRNCARARPTTWLAAPLRAAFGALHRDGWAHSVEVWEGEELVAGAFGVGMGAVFSGDSMFALRRNASKLAAVDLDLRLAAAGVTLVDCQWDSPHVRGLGGRPVPRADYLSRLRDGGPRRVPLPVDRRRVADLPLPPVTP